jgi:hypothetical protein
MIYSGLNINSYKTEESGISVRTIFYAIDF